MREVGERARAAARVLARASTHAKDSALDAIAAAIRRDEAKLLAANAQDVAGARATGNAAAFVDRLTLKPATVVAMADGLRQIAALADPVGEISDLKYRPTGIQVGRMRVPLGVVGIIYESRPNVTADAAGLCLKSGHACIDERADVEMAIRIADNAKTQRYSPCNTMETLLVHEKIAPRALPPLAKIYATKGVELRGDAAARRLVPTMKTATENDWYTEYLAPILAVRVVPSLDAAIEHIAKYGSQHTDAIVTEDYTNALRFLREVDSSSVLVNASTRFADGYEFGLGAEIGISTNKLHARGPVGLEGLTSRKWIVIGSGQIRA